MKSTISQYLKFLCCIVLLFIVCKVSPAQSTVQVMNVHFKDGAVSDIPLALVDSITFDSSARNSPTTVITDSITSNEVLQRAYLMASVRWTPLSDVPKRNGGIYPAGTAVSGIPYSSVKELRTYLFHDVSYHTFMTAVHSPMSVLYTENISQPPYHGTNCASYYGGVCSSSVSWALGFDLPYGSSSIIQLQDMEMLEHQTIDSLRVCDVIWKRGHVQMIYNIEYRNDTVYRIKTFETASSNAHFNNYTKSKFLNMWNTQGYVGYRYKKLIYSTEPLVLQDWEPIAYNDHLCPSKGDKSVYRTTDTVTIHIYDSSFSHIVLAKGSDLVAAEPVSGNSHQFHSLQPGIYTAHLQNGDEKTARVSFEIVETTVSYEWIDNGENIKIFFNPSDKATHASLCYLSGGSKSYKIQEVDRWRGYICVPRWDVDSDYYCRVLFRGEYGNITNKPIKVEPFSAK